MNKVNWIRILIFSIFFRVPGDDDGVVVKQKKCEPASVRFLIRTSGKFQSQAGSASTNSRIEIKTLFVVKIFSSHHLYAHWAVGDTNTFFVMWKMEHLS